MIVEDYSICSSQVYTQTTRAGAKQEDENIWSKITSTIGQIITNTKDKPSLPIHDHIPSVLQL